MLGEAEKYTANTGVNKVTTANTGLDGGGTLATILTAERNGTLVKTVTIKTQEQVGLGDIVRLFIYDGTNTRLFQEILLRPNGGGTGSVFATFSLVVPINFALKNGYVLKASTDITKKISVVAEGLNWDY